MVKYTRETINTKEYRENYKKVRDAYESTIDKKVSDLTWYQTFKVINEVMPDFDVMSSDAIKKIIGIAKIRKHCNFFEPFNKFLYCYKAYKIFSENGDLLTSEEFLNRVFYHLEVDGKTIPSSTRYYWFKRCNLKYRKNVKYAVKDMSFVAFFVALHKWNKEDLGIKRALPEKALEETVN